MDPHPMRGENMAFPLCYIRTVKAFHLAQWRYGRDWPGASTFVAVQIEFATETLFADTGFT